MGARGDVPESSGYHRSTMRDQLSLRLEPDVATLPNLPATLRPMLPRPLAEPFDSTAHLFEPSWGGLRALAFIGPAEVAGSGDVRLFDGEGRDVAPTLSELAGLAVRIDARSAVLDGELVVVDAAGRADADELARRLAGGRGRPVAFLAFDLLHIDGRSLLSAPLDRRREQLRRVLRPGDEVVAVPAIAGEGRALHEAAAAQGIAGVMARQRSSPYLPGVRSRLWRFIAVDGEIGSTAYGAAATRGSDSSHGATTSSSELDPDLEGGLSTPASAPVVALIRRLPLLFDD
jgi:bifunctional non-homologous end joining protein LigD